MIGKRSENITGVHLAQPRKGFKPNGTSIRIGSGITWPDS